MNMENMTWHQMVQQLLIESAKRDPEVAAALAVIDDAMPAHEQDEYYYNDVLKFHRSLYDEQGIEPAFIDAAIFLQQYMLSEHGVWIGPRYA